MIVCTGGGAPLAGGGQRLPANCKVEQTAPVCQAGLATLMVTDITGRWRQGRSTMMLTVDANHHLTGSLKDDFRVASITGGVFDAATRSLSFHFSVLSKNQQGTATLHVSADEGTLSGVWQLPTIGRGAWTFVRTAGPIPAQGPPPNNQPPAVAKLAGAWCSTAKPGSPELPASIAQNGTTLRFRNEYGMMSSGHFEGSNKIVANTWGNLHATTNGRVINWANSSIWRRGTNCGRRAASSTYGTNSSIPQAVCRSGGWQVSPLTNPSLSVSQVSIGGAACTLNITSHLDSASAIITALPRNGVLSQGGPLNLTYRPNPGFKGSDKYAFKYCGTQPGTSRSGCAILTYSVSVQ